MQCPYVFEYISSFKQISNAHPQKKKTTGTMPVRSSRGVLSGVSSLHVRLWISFECSEWYMFTISSAVRVDNYCNLDNEHSNITTPYHSQHKYASTQAGTTHVQWCASGYSGSGSTVTCCDNSGSGCIVRQRAIHRE